MLAYTTAAEKPAESGNHPNTDGVNREYFSEANPDIPLSESACLAPGVLTSNRQSRLSLARGNRDAPVIQ